VSFESSWFKVFGRTGGNIPDFASSYAILDEPNVRTFYTRTLSGYSMFNV
jgi:hypothetical protein